MMKMLGKLLNHVDEYKEEELEKYGKSTEMAKKKYLPSAQSRAVKAPSSSSKARHVGVRNIYYGGGVCGGYYEHNHNEGDDHHHKHHHHHHHRKE